MPEILVDIPHSLALKLASEGERSGTAISTIVTQALASHLAMPLHTLFQVSTADALVAGVLDREIDVRSVLEHGDLGLGTFANLDGEMVVLDGRAYRAFGNGRVAEANGNDGVPFAVVTQFDADLETATSAIKDVRSLHAACDGLRVSDNLFYAFRADARFDRVRVRVVNAVAPGTRLLDAAAAQSELSFQDIDGTLVGLWSPAFSTAVGVPGYHFHFLSDDRRHGGHLLDVGAPSLRLRAERLTDFHLALPETESFLRADLTGGDPEELAKAEGARTGTSTDE